jgi:hypothetical protein
MHHPREDRPSNFDGLAESLVSTGSQILVAMGTFDLIFLGFYVKRSRVWSATSRL